jgi:Ca2+-binding EF-hand superfamily protein
VDEKGLNIKNFVKLPNKDNDYIEKKEVVEANRMEATRNADDSEVNEKFDIFDSESRAQSEYKKLLCIMTNLADYLRGN